MSAQTVDSASQTVVIAAAPPPSPSPTPTPPPPAPAPAQLTGNSASQTVVIAAAPAPVTGAHRYWDFLLDGINGGTNAELYEMKLMVGSTNVAAGIAYTNQGSSDEFPSGPSLTDGSTTNGHHWYGQTGSGVRFDLGTAQAVDTLILTPYMPVTDSDALVTAFRFRWSDDAFGSATTVITQTAVPTTGWGTDSTPTPKSFSVAGAPSPSPSPTPPSPTPPSPAPAPSASNLNVAFFGDSITYGTGGSSSYPTQTGVAVGGGCSIVNHGVPGLNSHDLDVGGDYWIDRGYDNSQALNASYVNGKTNWAVLMIGTNDANGPVYTPSQTIGFLTDFIAHLKTRGFLKVFIGTLLCRDADGGGVDFTNRVTPINTSIRSTWAAMGADALIDFGADAAFSTWQASHDTTYFSGDNLHPNNAGYARMASIAAPVIAGALASGAHSLPSFVPPKLTGRAHFADLPVANTPLSTFPSMYGSSLANDPWTDYAGSTAYDRDRMRLIKRASGHHPGGTEMQAVAQLQLSSNPSQILWSWSNTPASPNVDAQTAINGNYAGKYANSYPDGTAYSPHTYNSINCVMPIAWGGAPSLIQPISNWGPTSWHKIDLTQATGGYRLMGGNNNPSGNDAGDAPDYPYYTPQPYQTGSSAEVDAVTWPTGQGFFYGNSLGQMDTAVFIDKHGKLDLTYPGVTGQYSFSRIVLDDYHGLLIGLNGGSSNSFPQFGLKILDLAAKTVTQPSAVTGNGTPLNYNSTSCEPHRFSYQWVPERDAAFGVDTQHTRGPQNDNGNSGGLPLLALVPPLTGSRKTGEWTTRVVPITHWSADTSGSPILQTAENEQTSAFVSLTWVPEWDSLILISAFGNKPQIIRLPEGFGPDPVASTVASPGPAPAPTPPSPPSPTPPSPTPPTPTPTPTPPSPTPPPSSPTPPPGSPLPSPSPTPPSPPSYPTVVNCANFDTTAIGLTGVRVEVFSTTTPGHVGVLLFHQGFSDSLNTSPVTMPSTGSPPVTVSFAIPSSVRSSMTIGQTLEVAFWDVTTGKKTPFVPGIAA